VKLTHILLAIVIVYGLCAGQEVKSQPVPTNVPGAEFPRLNSDLSVTFSVQADQAQKVQNEFHNALSFTGGVAREAHWHRARR